MNIATATGIANMRNGFTASRCEGGASMKTVNVQLTVPEGMTPFLDDSERDHSFERNVHPPSMERTMQRHNQRR